MRLSGLGPGLAEPPRAITAPREATARRRVTWREKREEGMLLSSRLYRKLLVLVVATLVVVRSRQAFDAAGRPLADQCLD